MKNKILSVSVGIAAYNEEKNIKILIDEILKQNTAGWKLKELLVFSDGSTDNTVSEVRKISDGRVSIFEDKVRKGKSSRINQIFQKAKGDIIVLFDADIKLNDNSTLSILINEFINDHNITLVGGNPRPFAPKSFFENAVYSTFYVLDQSRKFVKGGNSIYGCSGQCLAMKKEFAKTIKFPSKIVVDDDYIYFSCISTGKLFRHCRDAIVYYKLPKTLGDYVRQIFRADPDASVRNVQPYFGKIVSEEYHRPLKPYAKAVLQSFIQNPLGVMLMILIRLMSKPVGPIISSNYRIEWFTAKSTK